MLLAGLALSVLNQDLDVTAVMHPLQDADLNGEDFEVSVHIDQQSGKPK